jgi:hypothetical protein
MSLRSFLLSFALLLAPALALNGCGGESCSLIGCLDTVTLTVTLPDGSQPQDVKGQVTVGEEVLEFDCTTDTFTCDGGVIRLEVAPAEEAALNISSVAAGLSFIGAVTVTITTSAPNGEECGPICENGSAEVVLELTQAAP